MKRISILILLLSALHSSQSLAESQESKGEWFFHNGLVILPPLEGFETNLFLFSAKDNSIVIWSMSDYGGNRFCQEKQTKDFIDMNPISINEQYYKFTYMCLNGNALLVPKTDEGRKYLTNTVMSRQPVTVSLGDGANFHFPRSNINGMLAKKNAIAQAR